MSLCFKKPYVLFRIYGPSFNSTTGRNVIQIHNLDTGKIKCTLYSRFLFEIKLGRKLKLDEHVHHIDEDKTNDDIANLQLKNRSKHLSSHFRGKSKYDVNEIFNCSWCNSEFTLSHKQQSTRESNIRLNRCSGNTIFCSSSCATTYKHHNK